MAKLELKNVGYVYNPGTEFTSVALDGVSLAFEEGSITGIIGHTGSGKSTMVQLLNGLNKPSSGEVLLDGEDINETKEHRYEALKQACIERGEKVKRSALKKQAKEECAKIHRSVCFRVGLVMQYPEYQLFEETVEKDISFGPKNMGLPEDEIHRRVLETIHTVGLDEEFLTKSPFDLSGGQKRRVAIAGVLAMEPEILVLDEPAAGLDPKGREDIFACIQKYRSEHGATVLIVSHSMEDMAMYCDRVVVMNHGHLFLHDTRENVFSKTKELAEIGLDVPQITQLMMQIRKAGIPVPEGIYTVDDAVEKVFSILTSAKKEVKP